MPIPDFILALRQHVGHAPLWLPGATAVILRGEAGHEEVLLTLRRDLEVWAPVAGIVEPGEEPHVTAVREAQEEAGVQVEVEALVATSATDLVTYPNGDQTVYLDHTFRCHWVSGEARVSDDESLDVRWWPVRALPPGMRQLDRERIGVAFSNPRPPALGREAMTRLAVDLIGPQDAGTSDAGQR